MEQIIPFELQRFFVGDAPMLYFFEILARILIIYVYTLLLMRLTGKRGHSQLTLLELLMIIALGSAVGDVMFYPEVPILHALLVVTVIVGLEWLIAHLKRSKKWIEYFVNDRVEVIVKDGVLLKDRLRKENLSEQELYSMLREKEIEHLGQVRLACLELSGEISVFKYKEGEEKEGVSILPKI